MSTSRLAIVTAMVALLAGPNAQAQQRHRSDSLAAGPMVMQEGCMAFMKDGDHGLSRLMEEMHAAPQNRRMAAMMAVMDELVILNREMRAHMMGMMHGMRMTGMMSDAGPGDGRPTRKAPEPPAEQPRPDAADHEHQ